MFQDFFNYKIIMFDKPVYNQNCIGLTEKFFFCRAGLDQGSRSPFSLSTRFETFPLDYGSMLHFAE